MKSRIKVHPHLGRSSYKSFSSIITVCFAWIAVTFKMSQSTNLKAGIARKRSTANLPKNEHLPWYPIWFSRLVCLDNFASNETMCIESLFRHHWLMFLLIHFYVSFWMMPLLIEPSTLTSVYKLFRSKHQECVPISSTFGLFSFRG